MFKEHFPFAAATAVGLPLSLDNVALAILAMAAVIILIPYAYGADAHKVAERVRKKLRD